ncbi:MAG: hypothetical protein ACJAYE_000311 [Candidatus Azotimanducaceae bacterium]|jgi:hypothetical protein
MIAGQKNAREETKRQKENGESVLPPFSEPDFHFYYYYVSYYFW